MFIFKHSFNIFYFQNDVKKIAINLEATSALDSPLICFDDNCDFINNKNNIYSYLLSPSKPNFYKNFHKVAILLNPNDILKINSIEFFDGFKLNYIHKNQFSYNLIKVENSERCEILLPFKTNYKSIFQRLGVYFESIFYNWYFYIFSYILLIVYFYLNKTNFDLKIKPILIPILFIGLFLRLSHIDNLPLWFDESYTYSIISNLGELNFLNCFKDGGNPPLYFIISNIYLHFFNQNLAIIRFLPCLTGIILIYACFYIPNKLLNKNIGLLSGFLCAINILIINQSNEIRSYVLAMVLVLICSYYFYKLFSNFNNKDLIIYTIFAILLFNTHYYCILYLFFNLILGLILIKNNRIKFLISNSLAFLSFLPYFFYTFIHKSLSTNFNSWIPNPSFEVFKNHITYYFGNHFFFVLTIVFLIIIFKKNLLNKIEKNILFYSVSLIVFSFLSALLISLTIKPILFERYFCIFIPFLIINTSIFINLNYDKNLKPLIICLILLFSINMPKYETFNQFSNIDLFVRYSLNDIKKYPKEESFLVLLENEKYLNYFKKDFKNIENSNIIVTNLNNPEKIDIINHYKKIIKSKNKNLKKAVIYLPEMCINSKIKFSNQENIKTINTTIMPIYKIFIENL